MEVQFFYCTFAIEQNSIEMKLYRKLEIFPIRIEVEFGFLTGSVSTMPIKVGQVSVQEFDNGFSGSSFDEDFFTIGF